MNIHQLRSLQNKNLKRMIELCYKAHPYYQKYMKDNDLTPTDFKSVNDLARLPLISKTEYALDPESFRLNLELLPDLSLEEKTLSDILYTTGSTSNPTPFYDTAHDKLARLQHLFKSAQIAGIVPSDTVMNLFPLSTVTHQGPINASWATMTIGAKLLWGMTGRNYSNFPVHRRMTDAIDMIEDSKATVLWGITSYVRSILYEAERMGKNFSSVRLVLVMGEPCPSGTRKDMQERLKTLGSINPYINNGYGFTEMQAMAMECSDQDWRHQSTPEQYFFEILDPETRRKVPDGENGMLAISHLNRRGTVLLRYLVGDIVSLNHKICPECGRWEPRFVGTPYRADGVTKIKGILINPSILHEKMSLLFKRGLSEYQFVVGKREGESEPSIDSLILKIACAARDAKRLTREASELVVRTAEITPIIECKNIDYFSDISNNYKFSRFLDTRQ